MGNLVRLSFTLEPELSQALDQLRERKGYGNRSEFLRDLIRAKLVEEEWAADAEVVGTVTVVYDHHRRGLSERLTELQHGFHDVILATTHIHLDRDICVEAVLVKGKASRVREIADRLGQPKGVLHCSLAVATTGAALKAGAIGSQRDG
ncbi:MAG: nickel-responsive transcriptional regulator NikR [Acidobacteriota bacterium]